MLKSMNCKRCDKEFTYRFFKSSVDRKFCSHTCSNTFFDKSFYAKATKEQKLTKLRQLFEKKVIKKEVCWDILGFKDKNGYGLINFDRKNIRAHRASWMIHFGEIPKELIVCHTCDNTSCSRPSHLFLGTILDNNKDKIKKGRANYQRQESHYNSKLKNDDVLKIKELLKSGTSQVKISKIFNVTPRTIYKINRGLTWKTI